MSTFKNEDKFFEHMLKIMAFRTITNQDYQGIKNCFDFLATIAKEFGFESKMVANGKVLEITPKGLIEPAKLGYICHIDTVPFDISQWHFNPYGEIRDGKLYGRGSVDDKIGVMMSLYLMYNLKNLITNDWKIIIGSEEEGDWTDVKDYLAEGNQVPKFLITIDGDGIQNGCRGIVDLTLKFNRNKECKKTRISAFETFESQASNTVPGWCKITVDGKNHIAKGVESHSSHPEDGVNAITLAAIENNEVLTSEYPDFVEFIRFITNPNIPDEFEGSDFTPTVIFLNAEKGVLSVNLNCRIGVKVTEKEKVLHSIWRLKSDYNCQAICEGEVCMPAHVSADSEEIQILAAEYAYEYGHFPTINIARGIGYNEAFGNAIIVGPYPEVCDRNGEDLCHCPDEFIEIETVERMYHVLERFTYRYLSLIAN